MKLKVGIIGCGFVGESHSFAFSPTCEILVYDIDPLKSTHSLDEVYSSDFIFVCVPTPMNKDGSQNTSHTVNPVPIIIVNSDSNGIENGILADIAPTILDIIGIEKPKEMNGNTLLL